MAETSPGEQFDLFIIGGGINGAGIARDAAGRGLRVVLVEQDDLASATSSASSKLVHGGLRYLERYAFRLVREALAERDVLMAIAPHLVQPLRFVLPHGTDLRPAWLIRTGLFLYDHLGGRGGTLPRSSAVPLAGEAAGAGLKPEFRRGFAYSDCRVDDARLVIANARDAADHGALILTRTRCVAARRGRSSWVVGTVERDSGVQRDFAARILVNAAGPWAGEIAAGIAGVAPRRHLRLVKGSHVVVPRLYPGEHAFILQNDDRRIVFLIPYEGRFTLIGTTDVAVDGPPREVAITAAEVAYLQRVVARYFASGFEADDIVWSYAGIRPLYDDGHADPSAVTRDYVLELDTAAGAAPLLSVFGGKITTYRRLAEHTLEALAPLLPAMPPPWTATRPLPGGALAPAGLAALLATLARKHPGLPADLLGGLAARHGSAAETLLRDARVPSDLGIAFGGGLHERELEHFVRKEWARTADDVLWRRSKLGLNLAAGEVAAIARWLAARRSGATSALPGAVSG